jgi:hypothetical protein
MAPMTNDEALIQIATDAIEMFFEYRDQHGKSEEQAQALAVDELRRGLKAQEDTNGGLDQVIPKVEGV